VYAAVDRISSSLATVPFNIYERLPDGGRRTARENDQFRLVHTRPSHLYTSYQFRKNLLAQALLHGNGYALLVRDPVTTRPTEYRIIPDGDVTDIQEWDGELVYSITGIGAVMGYDMIHITAMGQVISTADSRQKYKGKSPIRLHAETVGVAKARQTHSASLMKNGGFVSGVIESPSVLKPEHKAALADSWQTRFGGSPNSGKTPILENGMTYKPLSITAADAQLIEAMKLGVEDIARIYGIPPHMIGHLERSTNNNIEHQAIEFVQYCLMPWAVQIEQAFDGRIFRRAEQDEARYFCRLELNALLRGDISSRREFYRLMLDRGVFNINEVRALEEMNAVAGGEIRLVQANMIPLDKIENHYESKSNGSPQN
jgi:HK97 family phage portal protein